MKKFICNRCCECCKNFGSGSTLPLFENEKKVYERLGVQTGVEISFSPENILMDKTSGEFFCLNWGLIGNPCPFLKNNKCSIYKDRALICKAFPINKIPENINNITPSCFMICQNNDSKKFIFSKRKLNEVYPLDSINSRLEIEKRKKEIEEKLIFLQNRNIISLIKPKKIPKEILSFNDFILRFNKFFF